MNAEKVKELLEMDVSEYTQKKGKLTYLSWANAWTQFIKVYPEATYKIKKGEDGECWFGNGDNGYMVYTEVTAGGTTHEMWLPVMDYRNKSMKNPTTFDINKAVMRCLTKNLAMFGLGLYIYAGEDLPDKDDVDGVSKKVAKKAKTKKKAKAVKKRKATTKEALEIEDLIKETDTDFDKFIEYFGVKDLSGLTNIQFTSAMKMLNGKEKKNKGDK